MLVGIAYWYRGHYIYGPAFNPIQPITFANKKEIMIAGTTAETAPPYAQFDKDRVSEVTIAALEKAMHAEWMRQLEEKRSADMDLHIEMNRMGREETGGIVDGEREMKEETTGAWTEKLAGHEGSQANGEY